MYEQRACPGITFSKEERIRASWQRNDSLFLLPLSTCAAGLAHCEDAHPRYRDSTAVPVFPLPGVCVFFVVL